jgi:phosphoribosylaminoimidazole carboxylase PurE protein
MPKTAKPEVAVVMGSDSDWGLMEKAIETLDAYGVVSEVRVMSAHRTPDEAAEFARTAAKRGVKIIIAAAGGAAHLGGVLAAHTTLPVIGVPIKGGALNGVDSLLATLQMPAGIPVATVTLGSAGPVNAALFAVQILALSQPALARKVVQHKRDMKKKVAKGNERVQAALAGRRG